MQNLVSRKAEAESSKEKHAKSPTNKTALAKCIIHDGDRVQPFRLKRNLQVVDVVIENFLDFIIHLSSDSSYHLVQLLVEFVIEKRLVLILRTKNWISQYYRYKLK